MCFQDELNSLVLWTSDFVAHSLQISMDIRLIRASSEIQTPARLKLTLKAHWNKIMIRRSRKPHAHPFGG